jgi:hypothetical protein
MFWVRTKIKTSKARVSAGLISIFRCGLRTQILEVWLKKHCAQARRIGKDRRKYLFAYQGREKQKATGVRGLRGQFLRSYIKH